MGTGIIPYGRLKKRFLSGYILDPFGTDFGAILGNMLECLKPPATAEAMPGCSEGSLGNIWPLLMSLWIPSGSDFATIWGTILECLKPPTSVEATPGCFYGSPKAPLLTSCCISSYSEALSTFGSFAYCNLPSLCCPSPKTRFMGL